MWTLECNCTDQCSRCSLYVCLCIEKTLIKRNGFIFLDFDFSRYFISSVTFYRLSTIQATKKYCNNRAEQKNDVNVFCLTIESGFYYGTYMAINLRMCLCGKRKLCYCQTHTHTQTAQAWFNGLTIETKTSSDKFRSRSFNYNSAFLVCFVLFHFILLCAHIQTVNNRDKV